MIICVYVCIAVLLLSESEACGFLAFIFDFIAASCASTCYNELIYNNFRPYIYIYIFTENTYAYIQFCMHIEYAHLMQLGKSERQVLRQCTVLGLPSRGSSSHSPSA